MRALIGLLENTNDISKLASLLSPQISQDEARSAIEILKSLNLIEPNGKEGWNITDRSLSTGKGDLKSQAVKKFHHHTLELAQQALDKYDKEERENSSVVFTMNESDLPEIKRRIAEFRRELLQFARKNEKANRVYALNFSIFPLTQTIDACDLEATYRKTTNNTSKKKLKH